MKLVPSFAFFLAACLASGAEAVPFNTTVSANFANHHVVIMSMTAPMDTDWFIQRTGGRTVWGDNAKIGHKTHDAHLGHAIYAHATFVISTAKDLHDHYTVNINADKVHITSWYPDADQDRSHQCGADPASATIRAGFVAAARASRFAATYALQQQGVTVTNNP
jgi:hypothetical protein